MGPSRLDENLTEAVYRQGERPGSWLPDQAGGERPTELEPGLERSPKAGPPALNWM